MIVIITASNEQNMNATIHASQDGHLAFIKAWACNESKNPKVKQIMIIEKIKVSNIIHITLRIKTQFEKK